MGENKIRCWWGGFFFFNFTKSLIFLNMFKSCNSLLSIFLLEYFSLLPPLLILPFLLYFYSFLFLSLCFLLLHFPFSLSTGLVAFCFLDQSCVCAPCWTWVEHQNKGDALNCVASRIILKSSDLCFWQIKICLQLLNLSSGTNTLVPWVTLSLLCVFVFVSVLCVSLCVTFCV